MYIYVAAIQPFYCIAACCIILNFNTISICHSIYLHFMSNFTRSLILKSHHFKAKFAFHFYSFIYLNYALHCRKILYTKKGTTVQDNHIRFESFFRLTIFIIKYVHFIIIHGYNVLKFIT